MKIGDKAFCSDPKTRKVFKAEVTAFNVAQSGYQLVGLLLDKGETKNLESAHCFTKKEDAEKHLERINPLLDEADKIMDDGKKRIDEIRIEILGEPAYLELSERIMNPHKAPKLKAVK